MRDPLTKEWPFNGEWNENEYEYQISSKFALVYGANDPPNRP